MCIRDSYHSAYTVTYADGSTAVNTLRPTRIYAEKQWNKSSQPVPVAFALEYLAADGGGYVELARVTVDGKADAAPAQPYYCLLYTSTLSPRFCSISSIEVHTTSANYCHETYYVLEKPRIFLILLSAGAKMKIVIYKEKCR